MKLHHQAALATVASTRPITFPEILELLHTAKHTGPVTFHFIHGVPTAAELVQEPVKVVLARTAAPDAPLTRSADLAHTSR